MTFPGLGAAALAVCLATLPGAVRAEAAPPLALTVHPSGFEPAPGSLEEKLARRLRESAHLFRSICRGCGRHSGLVESREGPFEPQRSLDASRRR